MGGPHMSQHSELYACLYVREFPAQALLRLRPELRIRPFIVMDGDLPLQHVCSLNTKARKLGVARGMTKVEIETFPMVSSVNRSTKEESAAKTALLECVGTFSPRIEDRSSDAVFICVLDIAGTEKLFGEPRVLGQKLLRSVRALGISASVTVCSNVSASICMAHGIARHEVTIIGHGQEGVALASLPVKVLALTQDQQDTFVHWGIHTLGMLAVLPEKELIARMGQEGKRLRQLARGEQPHLFIPYEAPLQLQEHIELDTPVEQLDSLLFVVSMMVQQLIVRATARVLALASITVTLGLEGGSTHARSVRPALPTNDRQLWLKLLHLDLEAHPPQAPILALSLTADPGSTSKVQLGLFTPQLPEPMRLDVTLARIRAIVGESNVGSPVLQDTHRFGMVRVDPFSMANKSSSWASAAFTGSAMRILRPAESVYVTVCNLRPSKFTFRHARYDVERAYGPWATSGEWWNPGLWQLEQWDIVARSNQDTLLYGCMVRELGQQSWQMVALYD